jgi:hypothetical protein
MREAQAIAAVFWMPSGSISKAVVPRCQQPEATENGGQRLLLVPLFLAELEASTLSPFVLSSGGPRATPAEVALGPCLLPD